MPTLLTKRNLPAAPTSYFPLIGEGPSVTGIVRGSSLLQWVNNAGSYIRGAPGPGRVTVTEFGPSNAGVGSFISAVNTANNTVITTGGARTWAFWIRVPNPLYNPGTTPRIFTFIDPTASVTNVCLIDNTNGQLTYQAYGFMQNCTTAITANTWEHWIIVHDGTASGTSFFLNGVKKTSGASQGAGFGFGTLSCIGARSEAGDGVPACFLANLACFDNFTLTDPQANGFYAAECQNFLTQPTEFMLPAIYLPVAAVAPAAKLVQVRQAVHRASSW